MADFKKSGCVLYCFVFLFMMGIFLALPKQAQAAVFEKDILCDFMGGTIKTSCKIDLNGDGKKESLKLKAVRDEYEYLCTMSLYIDGRKVLSSPDYGEPLDVQVHYIKMSKSKILLNVKVVSDGYDTIDGIYRYDASRKKLLSVGKLLDQVKTEGWAQHSSIVKVTASEVKIRYTCLFLEFGTVDWVSAYVWKQGKLCLKSNTANVKFRDTAIFPDEYTELFKENKFVAQKSMKFYTNSSMKKISFRVKDGDTVTLKKIKYTGGKFYMQFLKDSKTGWLRVGDGAAFYGVNNRMAG